MAGLPAPLPQEESLIGPEVVVGEPVEVAEGVVRLTAANPGVMTGPGTNTYLVGSDELAVIDPGPELDGHLDGIERAARAAGGRIRWVLVTHHHPDHAPAARPLADRTGAQYLAHGHPEGVDPDRKVGGGFVLEGPGFRLRAVHTPGHASDHLCWMLEERSILFSGDHVMQGSTVVIKPPDANMTEYLGSLRGLLELDPPIAAIAPGHGSMIGDPAAVIDSIVRHRLAREEVVAAALAEAGPSTVAELMPRVYPDVDEKLEPVARGSLWAHLQKLAADCRAARRDDTGSDPLRSTESSRWEALAR
ncbi:MAG: MBL fold metallo-hydrolase [Acidimicrobiales bacterium]